MDVNKSVETALDSIMDDLSLDDVKQRAKRVAQECRIFFDAFKKAGFNEGQAFELLLTSSSMTTQEIDLDDLV